jgi:hypothetical protein
MEVAVAQAVCHVTLVMLAHQRVYQHSQLYALPVTIVQVAQLPLHNTHAQQVITWHCCIFFV